MFLTTKAETNKTKKPDHATQKQELISGFILETRRGSVILCVLAKLQKPLYGYSLIAELARSGFSIEANTLYPLLRRLESQGLLQSEWNTEGAKPRKYYRTTDFGREALCELKAHWQTTTQSVQNILEETP
ncbi:MAG: PadR family transcriptional regulator [Clostridia bacterium]|nr:PadR family transcriptional regulator [Clostridia bacterium]